MNHLTSVQMDRVGEVFLDALRHVLANQTPTTQKRLVEMLVGTLLREKPYLATTLEGAKRYMEVYWTNEEPRDFILSLSFAFFSRLGETDEFVNGLAENLARGCSVMDVNQHEVVLAIPAPARDRLADSASASSIIRSNRWLMIVLLIQLFVTTHHLNLTETKGREKP